MDRKLVTFNRNFYRNLLISPCPPSESNRVSPSAEVHHLKSAAARCTGGPLVDKTRPADKTDAHSVTQPTLTELPNIAAYAHKDVHVWSAM